MDNLLIHHIGIVIKNIDKYMDHSLFKNIEKRVYDPIQHSNIVLLKTNNDLYLEIIEPIDKNSTTYNFLNSNGGGYHHICFLLENQQRLKEIIEEKKIKIFWGPKPATLFNNRNIVFGLSRNKELIEFIINN